MQAQEIECHPRQRADYPHRQQHANRGQGGDRPSVIEQPAEIDVQCAREQQQAEQPVHQCLVEIDLPQEALDVGLQLEARNEVLERDDDERADEGDEQGTAGRRQVQQPVIHVAGHRGDRDQNGGGIKDTHDHGVRMEVATFAVA